ncbi:MAG: hypothetical protein ACI3VJ_03250 [Hominicoprocola sp.]
MAHENEQKNISFEDVWGRRESANIISGKISTPFCLGFLSVYKNEKDYSHIEYIMDSMRDGLFPLKDLFFSRWEIFDMVDLRL